MVEQRTENPRVTGSIPVLGIIFYCKGKWVSRLSFFGTERLNYFYFNVSLFLLLVICVGNLFSICWEFWHNHNKKILSMVVAISVFCLFACLELIHTLINIRRPLGVYLQIGVLAFYIVICVFSIRNTLRFYLEGLRSEYYKKLSYTDQMTGCLNRHAFTEREIRWTPGGSDVLLMADLNNLKQINDVMGHCTGDLYIERCAATMREIFKNLGDCYRMGGDEFLFWGAGISEEKAEELEENTASSRPGSVQGHFSPLRGGLRARGCFRGRHIRRRDTEKGG